MSSQPSPELDARFSDPNATPTPWADARDVLETAQLAWITTVRRDGRPHVTPLVTVWLDDTLYFTTGASEQKGHNLAANPHVVITTGCNRWDDGTDVVVEGDAERVTDTARLDQLAAAWRGKWDGSWQFDVGNGVFLHGDGNEALVYGVKPTKVLAFGKGRFSHTRYRF
jgi:general stress protein 26